MQLTDMLGFYLLELQGATTTANDASIIESLKGVPFGLALLTTAFCQQLQKRLYCGVISLRNCLGRKQLLESLFQACFSEPFMDRPILPLG